MKLLAILLLFTLVSCSQEEWMVYDFEIENASQFNAKEKGSINGALLSKLKKFGFQEASLHNEGDRLIVEALMNPESKSEDDYFKSIFESNKLEFFDAYKVSDREMMSLDTLALKVPYFTPCNKQNPRIHAEEVLGYTDDVTRLEEIRSNISALTSHIDNMKLYWSEGIKDMSTGKIISYNLYMLDDSVKGLDVLSEQDIEEVYAVKDDFRPDSYAVAFNFNQKATAKWAEMTERASINGNRTIAIVLNERVHSIPSVMSPIYSGHCSLSGNFTKEEAEQLANSIAVGRLDYKLKFIGRKAISIHHK